MSYQIFISELWHQPTGTKTHKWPQKMVWSLLEKENVFATRARNLLCCVAFRREVTHFLIDFTSYLVAK